MNAHVPTQLYSGLQHAFDSMNKDLFEGKLPPCLLTLRSAARSYGYYHTARFVEAHAKGAKPVAEIALNPIHFAERKVEETLATLLHEMVHLWQAVYGKEPTRCYHDRQWAAKMKEVGLYPSSTGEKGGKETGPKVSHYIIKDGPFYKWYKEYLSNRVGENGGIRLYQDRLAAERALGRRGKGKGGEEGEGEGEEGEGEAKSTGRAKFCCKGCGLNAWAKPSAKLRCDDCKRPMRVEVKEDDDGEDEA